jgi:hypothetical protein
MRAGMKNAATNVVYLRDVRSAQASRAAFRISERAARLSLLPPPSLEERLRQELIENLEALQVMRHPKEAS